MVSSAFILSSYNRISIWTSSRRVMMANNAIGPVSYYYPQMLAGAGIENNHTQLLLVRSLAL